MFWGNIDKIVIPEGEVYSIESNGLTIWTIAKYLSVTPVDVQWITPENEITYQVTSNTDWTIT